MATFAPKGSVTQSADGKTETFNDQSNYTGTDEGVTLNNILGRTLVSYLPDGSVYLSQAITGANLTAPIPVTKDLALSHVLSVTLANASVRVATVNYISTRFYDILQRTRANLLNCKCASNKALCSNLTKAMSFASAAISFNAIGDRMSAQEQIDAANAYVLLKSDCGC